MTSTGAKALLAVPAFIMGSLIGTLVARRLSKSFSRPKKVRLQYFDGRGVVEISRVLMRIGKLEFDDVRFEIETTKDGRCA
jgi:hypothetical protein